MKKLFVVIIVTTMLLSGCAENLASVKNADIVLVPVALVPRNYTILDPVVVHGEFIGVLGYGDSYLFRKGGLNYSEIFKVARREYTDIDAVIDIRYEHTTNSSFIFHTKRAELARGLAIKYER